MERVHCSEPTPPTTPHAQPASATEPPWVVWLRAFAHENFVAYNPLYLLSAALVLFGLVLLLLEPALESDLGGLAISGLAELYAFALIGGAAILVRGGERRAAVMLGLLMLLFQCDVTLHVERAALMDTGGALVAVVWLALFDLKLRLLGRALELTPSGAARWVPTIGAAALAGLPHVLPSLSLDARGSLVALVVFGLGALVLYTHREVESAVGFDYRGRRAIRATWAMLAAGFLLHVLDWALESSLPIARIVPALALLSLRSRALTERRTYGVVLVTLASTALLDPGGLWVVAAMASAALTLRALRKPQLAPLDAEDARARAPYRFASSAPAEPARRRTIFALAPAPERERLLLGAATALHLAAWSALSPHGIPHAHVAGLDVALVALVLATVARSRRWTSTLPAIGIVADLLVETGWLRVPRGPGEAAAWALASGFVLLAAGVAVTLRPRDGGTSARDEPRPASPTDDPA